MGGMAKTFTLDVTKRAQQYACLKSKMEIVLEDSLKFRGHLTLTQVRLLETMMLCCLTFLAIVISHLNELERIYYSRMLVYLALAEEEHMLSYAHGHHLMAMETANLMQISMVIISQ